MPTNQPTNPQLSNSLTHPIEPVVPSTPALRSPPLRLHSRSRVFSGIITSKFINRQRITRHPASHIFLPNSLPLLPTRQVAVFTRHDAARMDDVEEDEGGEHEGGVEDVLVRFVDRDAAFVALGVFG